MANVFETPASEMSFSGLIDEALRITGRVTALAQAVGYANAVFRECQVLGLFDGDSEEIELFADASPFVYEIPPSLRTIRTAHYGYQDIYPKFLQPGAVQRYHPYLYYRVQDSYVFKGINPGEPLRLFYYKWLPRLGYFKRLEDGAPITKQFPVRSAFYDPYSGKWSYLDRANGTYTDSLGSSEAESSARNESANWLILHWYELVLEGVKGKLWNAVGDERGKTSYSLYKSYLDDLSRTIQSSEDL